MKIAMVTPWKVRCGIFTYSEKLAYALAEQDVEVYIVRLPRLGLKLPEIIQDVATRIPGEAEVIHVQHEYGLYRGVNQGFYRELQYHKLPIVTTMHSVGNWDVDGGIASASKRVIVHNTFCRKRFAFPNATIIPHGASPAKPAAKDVSTQAWGIDSRSPLVGYLGFISSGKGLDRLIEAMIPVKNAGLVIAGGWHREGGTDYINQLKEWTLKVLPARAQWLGFVPKEKMDEAYGAMDFVVYPSRFATESGALITALSYGKAVIASDIAPFREKKKEGALITFKSVRDLTRKIKRLLKDTKLREKLEEGARKYAEKTSWTHVAAQHIELYKELLKVD